MTVHSYYMIKIAHKTARECAIFHIEVFYDTDWGLVCRSFSGTREVLAALTMVFTRRPPSGPATTTYLGAGSRNRGTSSLQSKIFSYMPKGLSS